MARTRVRWDRVVVLTSALLATMWAAGQALGGADPVPQPIRDRYRVRPGDTLWAIARREVGPEGDPRPLVADIRETNDLGTGILVPGRTLVVPGG